MKRTRRYTLWVMASAFSIASCTQGSPPPPAGPSGAPAEGDPGLAGLVSGSAAGDVQSGPIEIFNVRIRQEGRPGFYAEPGGVYRLTKGVKAEFWVEWRSAQPLPNVPRLVIDWGFGEADNIHCGPCLLDKAFPEGVFEITVRLDDRSGGTTTRTFRIEAAAPDPCEGTAFVGNLDGSSLDSRFELGVNTDLPTLGWVNLTGTARVFDGAGGNGAIIHRSSQYANYEVQYDTGVAIKPLTTYTLHFDMGYLAGLTGGNSGYRFHLGTLNGGIFTPLGTSVGVVSHAGNMTAGTISGRDEQVVTMGSSVTGGTLAVRWAQTSSLGPPSSDFFGFDNVTLTACTLKP